ncbi:unnamed protein product [Arctogadus glacialis]
MTPAFPAYQYAPAMPAQPAEKQYALQPQYTQTRMPSALQPSRQPVPVPKLPNLVNDNLLSPHTEFSEHYKYCVLMEHLVLEEARLIAQSCRHYASPTPPYSHINSRKARLP